MPVRKRLPLRAAICLALGVLINIAVAWGCALRLDPDEFHGRPVVEINEPAFAPAALERLRRRLPYRASDDETLVCDEIIAGAQRRIALVAPYWRATTGFHREITMTSPASMPLLLVRTRAGWPWPALESMQALAEPASSGVWPSFDRRWMGRLALPNDVDRRTLPLKPMWPGFAFNALLYAAPGWLLLFGPGVLRRLHRRRHGRCEVCGYPRGDSDVCSECGAALAMPAQSRKPAHDPWASPRPWRTTRNSARLRNP